MTMMAFNGALAVMVVKVTIMVVKMTKMMIQLLGW